MLPKQGVQGSVHNSYRPPLDVSCFPKNMPGYVISKCGQGDILDQGVGRGSPTEQCSYCLLTGLSKPL
eukprot:7401628-Heterocapsa_arctica.AAC.1